MILATVKFRKEVFHNWPDANEERAYLRHHHRHMMHIEASVEVTKENRQIEFHDLLDKCHELFPNGEDPTDKSCETLGRELALALRNEYGKDRLIKVSVFEDGEMGATYVLDREE